MTNEAAKSESKTPPPSKPPSDESVLNQDYDTLELDNFSTKTAISIEATVTEGEINEEKAKEKTTSSDKSKTEDKDIKFNSDTQQGGNSNIMLNKLRLISMMMTVTRKMA